MSRYFTHAEVEADLEEARADEEIWHIIDPLEDEEPVYDSTNDEFDEAIAGDEDAADENL